MIVPKEEVNTYNVADCIVRDIKNRILHLSNSPILEFKVPDKSQRAF